MSEILTGDQVDDIRQRAERLPMAIHQAQALCDSHEALRSQRDALLAAAEDLLAWYDRADTGPDCETQRGEASERLRAAVRAAKGEEPADAR